MKSSKSISNPAFYLLITVALATIVSGYSQDTTSSECNIILKYEVIDVSCKGGGDGSIDLTLENVNYPVFQWSNGEISEDLHMISSGNYFVTITDEKCILIDTISINEPAEDLQLSITNKEDINCFGTMDGSIEVLGQGGSEPYVYSLNDKENYQSNNIFTNLAAGEYSVFVKDRNDCESSTVVIIDETSQIKIDLGTNVTIESGKVIQFDAGSRFSEYLWSTGDITQTIDFSREVNVKTIEKLSIDAVDDNGCLVTSNTVEITIIPIQKESEAENQ